MFFFFADYQRINHVVQEDECGTAAFPLAIFACKDTYRTRARPQNISKKKFLQAKKNIYICP